MSLGLIRYYIKCMLRRFRSCQEALVCFACLNNNHPSCLPYSMLASILNFGRVQDTKSQHAMVDNYLQVFRLFLRLYYYSHAHGTFVAVPAMPWTIPDKICDALTSLRSIDQGTHTHLLLSDSPALMHVRLCCCIAVAGTCSLCASLFWSRSY